MRKSLKKFVSILMALTILFSLAVPTALAAEQIKIPITVKIPKSVAGVEFDFTYTDGLKFVKWEKSDAVKTAGQTGPAVNNGVTKAGIFTASNDYAPDANGELDLGYLVFEGDTKDQSVTIAKTMYVIVVDKDTMDSRTVGTPVTFNLSDLDNSGSAGGSSAGIVIDGSNAPANVNTVGEQKFPFVDVKTTDWFYDEVKGAYNNGLINGVTATEYRPNETLTVAQAIKLAAALHQLDKSGKVTLANGTNGVWYSTYVKYAVDNKIIESKYQNYTAAQMNAAITRSEFVHIFHGAMSNYTAINTVADNAIPDVKTGATYASEIYEFYRAGILTGSNGGTFYPNNAIKRSEVAAILVRMYDTSVRESITLN